MRHVQLVGGSVKIERFGKDSEIAKLAQVHDCNPLSLGEINIGFGFGKSIAQYDKRHSGGRNHERSVR